VSQIGIDVLREIDSWAHFVVSSLSHTAKTFERVACDRR
jgi:hypothetical protein